MNADHQRRQRERIIVAAEGCFVDSGFHTASMDEIVSRAGMSSSTVYSYFPGGKRELIRAVCTNRLEPVYDEVEEYANREDPPSLLPDFSKRCSDASGIRTAARSPKMCAGARCIRRAWPSTRGARSTATRSSARTWPPGTTPSGA